MKNILYAIVLMFCLVGERCYAQEILINNYVYRPVPVVVNVPVTHIVYVPVTTIVTNPVIYYPPTYMTGNWPTIYRPVVVVEKPRCWFLPRQY